MVKVMAVHWRKMHIGICRMVRELVAGHSEPEPSSRLVVLVVDDEVLVRMTLAEALREHGYSVLEAASGDEALVLLASGIPCHVVVSDVQMPGTIDGLALLRQVNAERPDLPVVLTSGHLAGADARGAAGFFPKPYVTPDVVSLVARLIGSV
jgi:CheY-like chemotaxis protein